MRQLPDDPKRRRMAVFRRIYQGMPHWYEQIVAGLMDDIIVDPETNEEIFYGDLLIGIDTLPPRQREAFELICLQGYTETAAAKIMLPGSRWSTTVQQHVNAALERMIARYDEQQSGVRSFIQRLRRLMSLHPVIGKHVQDGLKAAKRELIEQINDLKVASNQVDQMLKETLPPSPPDPKPVSKPTEATAGAPSAGDDALAAAG